MIAESNDTHWGDLDTGQRSWLDAVAVEDAAAVVGCHADDDMMALVMMMTLISFITFYHYYDYDDGYAVAVEGAAGIVNCHADDCDGGLGFDDDNDDSDYFYDCGDYDDYASDDFYDYVWLCWWWCWSL